MTENLFPLTLDLTPQDYLNLHCCLAETGGYAGDFLRQFIKTIPIDIWWDDKLSSYPLFRCIRETPPQMTLSFQEWLDLYHLINAVKYELGPEELSTITGRTLKEMSSTNRKIFCLLYDRYYGGGWEPGKG